ncbi:hypothetical protein HK098_003406 [Nowakowskiella sp. JEL0407]|nr:hypothetical protein HK098_003406 [Nowakowskiella sp. JEL0407]
MHHGRVRLQKDRNAGKDGSWMDNERKRIQAYEYLCHVGEAKEWIENCIKESIPPIESMEEDMRNGIFLAKLAKYFQPDMVKKIFEDRTRLQYRHSDNINYLFTFMHSVGLPEVFFFELTDLYEKKNIPKVIYCIHALSHLLTKKGLGPSIKDLIGKLDFTDEQIESTQQSLEESGVPMPRFGEVQSALAKELQKPELTEEEKKELYFKENLKKIIQVQSASRSYLARKHLQKLRAEKAEYDRMLALKKAEEERIEYETKVVLCQSQVRMAEARKEYKKQKYWKSNAKAIILAQSLWRGRKNRNEYKLMLSDFKEKEKRVIWLQSQIRAVQQRRVYLNRMKHFHNNERSIVMIQSKWRGRHAEKAYRALASLNNPKINVLKDFVHLLDDSDNDFEEELELEKLRQSVIRLIRENLQTESELGELDVKIALLVKNRISIEEVVHLTSKKAKIALSGDNLSEGNQFSLKGLDKETRAKLENYQDLFYLLQTQPQYLARLLFHCNKTSGGNVTKFLENVSLTLYGYAQNTREEYLFLNLIKTCIKMEIDEISDLGEFWRANPLFIKLVLHYTRGAKERAFLRELLQPIVKKVMQDSSLDLDSDPISIYKVLIREEESRTGEKSSRNLDATPQQAAADPEVSKIQQLHIEKLREITDLFLTSITSSLKKMPFGIRYIAMQMKETFKAKFDGCEEEIMKIVGNLIYYRYMNPAIVAPEAFDVIESNVTPTQRKNLAEIAKTLHQISVNRLNPADDPQQEKLNEYITKSSKAFTEFLREASTVCSSEEYFNIDEFVDQSRTQKPVLYITPNEIFHVHKLLLENQDFVVSETTDPLRQILNDLGTCPDVKEGKEVPGNEMALTLTNRFAKLKDQNLKLKQLFMETKRFVLTIIRVQSGGSLLGVLEAPVTEKEESLWNELLSKEVERHREKKALVNQSNSSHLAESRDTLNASKDVLNQLSPTSATGLAIGSNWNLSKTSDGQRLTFTQLKRKALENMDALEAEGLVSKKNSYQDMINSIATDMINKHKRRNQRRRELLSLRNTLKNLEEKSGYLNDQKKSYHDYINSCMSQLTNKKSKTKRQPFMFSRQYYHLRELQKDGGKIPQFGSFKFTADNLYKKGVLISIQDYSPKQYGGITLTISSDEAGVFNIEASFLGIKMPEKLELRLEDLLQSQYDNVQVMTIFDIAKVNINLLIYLINKKYV